MQRQRGGKRGKSGHGSGDKTSQLAGKGASLVPAGVRSLLTRQFAEARELLSHFWALHAVRFPQSKREAAFSLVSEFERRHASVSSALSRASVRELPEKRRGAVDAMAAPLLLQLQTAIAAFDEWHAKALGKARVSTLAAGGGGATAGSGGGFVEVVDIT